MVKFTLIKYLMSYPFTKNQTKCNGYQLSPPLGGNSRPLREVLKTTKADIFANVGFIVNILYNKGIV